MHQNALFSTLKAQKFFVIGHNPRPLRTREKETPPKVPRSSWHFAPYLRAMTSLVV